MPEGPLLIGFIAASLVVLLIPGPGVLYVVARSVAQGYRAGLASALGLSVGVFAHVAAAAVGLSALLLTSATAFGIVKALGAGYLIYLGLKILFEARRPAAGAVATGHIALGRLFLDGVIVSVFNPKIAIFFLAFLPQFVDPAAGPPAPQVMALGLLYAALALMTDGSYALFAASLRHWTGGRFLRGALPQVVTGLLYIGLGLNAALTGRRN